MEAKPCVNCGKDIHGVSEKSQHQKDLNNSDTIDVEEEADIVETLSNAAKSANYEHLGNRQSVSFPVNTNVEYTDSDRELKDLCTKFVVDQFFGVSDNLFNFMTIVVDTYTHHINQYIKDNNLPDGSILFIYKVFLLY